MTPQMTRLGDCKVGLNELVELGEYKVLLRLLLKVLGTRLI